MGRFLALLFLALQRPRRWIFIAGSCEQLYLLIAFLLRTSSDDFSQPSFVTFLFYASWAMCLTGFFVKPPRTLGRPRSRVTSAGINQRSTAQHVDERQ